MTNHEVATMTSSNMTSHSGSGGIGPPTRWVLSSETEAAIRKYVPPVERLRYKLALLDCCERIAEVEGAAKAAEYEADERENLVVWASRQQRKRALKVVISGARFVTSLIGPYIGHGHFGHNHLDEVFHQREHNEQKDAPEPHQDLH